MVTKLTRILFKIKVDMHMSILSLQGIPFSINEHVYHPGINFYIMLESNNMMHGNEETQIFTYLQPSSSHDRLQKIITSLKEIQLNRVWELQGKASKVRYVTYVITFTFF